MSSKAKVYCVSAFGDSYLVMAMTKAGAVRDLLDHLKGGDALHADIATGWEIFNAARDGQEIIGIDRYHRTEDPDQMPLDGVPEAAAVERETADQPF